MFHVVACPMSRPKAALSFQNIGAVIGRRGLSQRTPGSPKCGRRKPSVIYPIRSPVLSNVSTSVTGTPDHNDDKHVFEKSKLNDLREDRRNDRVKDVTNEQKHEKDDASNPSFETHADLMDALLDLNGDPLECDGGKIVLFRGNVSANVMIIGEAPGEQEDIEGKPFVGKAGQLLDNIFRYGGFDIERQLYVTNIAKRRPSDNRTPTAGEVEFYLPYVLEEIRLVAPDIVVLAGAVATRAILGKSSKISTVRGCWFENVHGVAWTMPIFHPSFLLRKPTMKKDMVVDIHSIREKYIDLFPGDSLNDLTPVSTAQG